MELFGTYLSLCKQKLQIDNSKQNDRLLITVQSNSVFPIGTILPICIDGIKISEARVNSVGLFTNIIEIRIKKLDDYVPTFEVVEGNYSDIGNVNKNTLKIVVHDYYDYETLKYIHINGRYK